MNKKKPNLDSYDLGVIWKYITDGRNLNRAHESIVDTNSQNNTVINKIFTPSINHISSVRLIYGIFSKKKQNKWRKDMNPIREVHATWKEIKIDSNIKW